MKNRTKNKIEIAKKRVESLWNKVDNSSILLGLGLLQLTDAVDDGEAGYNWDKLVGATSFADYCRKLGMENRVEYKYRNAAQNIVDNRPELVEDYKLVDDIEYLPGYSLLNLVEENKDKLKKVDGAWENVIELLYDKKESRYNIQVAISEYLDNLIIRTGSNNNCKKEALVSSKINSEGEELGVDINENESYPEEIIEEFYYKLRSNLPVYITEEDFEMKFKELADMFGVPIGIAA